MPSAAVTKKVIPPLGRGAPARSRVGGHFEDEDLVTRFSRVRDTTLALCASLEIEDCVVQSMPEASPLKWHLAHTTWFFEQFILQARVEDYRVFDRHFAYLFNSYYHVVGAQHERAERGTLSRPTVSEVIRYRRYVDEAVQNLMHMQPKDSELIDLVTLGLNHEQQHQELMLTDIKHALSRNPAQPAYRVWAADLLEAPADVTARELRFVPYDGGIQQIGAQVATNGEFSFDNERPRHRVLVEPFQLADRLISNGEYLEFIRDGGYRRAELWLSDGWECVQRLGWTRPMYWSEGMEGEFTLHGLTDLKWDAPVCHVSFYEADAFARWAGKRLPTENEWETVASAAPVSGNLFGSELFHPLAVTNHERFAVKQLFGDVWEWTASPYAPYSGFKPLRGALGEYNGKFMSNRMVLRGGSCATPDDHIRASYRNFFDPHTRWQFSGVRLAQ